MGGIPETKRERLPRPERPGPVKRDDNHKRKPRPVSEGHKAKLAIKQSKIDGTHPGKNKSREDKING
jgi:hypothetical protein